LTNKNFYQRYYKYDGPLQLYID